MEEVEVLMREEPRQMIRDGAPMSVDEQIDLILIKMETVKRMCQGLAQSSWWFRDLP